MTSHSPRNQALQKNLGKINFEFPEVQETVQEHQEIHQQINNLEDMSATDIQLDVKQN